MNYLKKIDRNFDDLAEKFNRKIYGGLKGDIRLAVIWRDLNGFINNRKSSKPLNIIDIGAGLGQFAIRLSELGHHVTYNDVSKNMLDLAQKSAIKQGQISNIIWQHCAYQDLTSQDLGKYDLVLCHALIEWLAEPEALIAKLADLKTLDGSISLTFYNANALVYQNLIKGNFKVLESPFQADSKSLTPHTPFTPKVITTWVTNVGLCVVKSSGIRVFHDYVTTRRGGHVNDEAVINKELEYSEVDPYKWLGRYVHFMLE